MKKLLEPIYNAYKSTASYIWHLLERSNHLKISVQEETITEMSLLQLKEKLQDKIYVDTYTKKQEKKNGADWEWLIVEADRAIEFRVQAKRLYIEDRSITYKQLHYEDQTKNLIEKARVENKIPLYCFFNYIPQDHLQKLGFPKTESKPQWESLIPSVSQDFSTLGWTFTFGEYIWRNKGKKSFNEIGALCKGIDFFNRDLEDIVNEYNAIKDDEDDDQQGGRGLKFDPKDSGPGGGGAAKGADSNANKLEMKKPHIKVKNTSELNAYQRNLLFKLGLYDVAPTGEDISEPDELSMTVVTVVEYNSHSADDENEKPLSQSPAPNKEEDNDSVFTQQDTTDVNITSTQESRKRLQTV